jgi:hypothetical protein
MAQSNDWLDIKDANVLPAKKVIKGPTRAQLEQITIQQFSNVYLQQGKPGIAILWNRRFADVFSQWQADSRQSSEVTMSGRPFSSKGNASDGAASSESDSSSEKDIDCSLYLRSSSNGDCNYTRRSYNEKRIKDDPEINELQHSSQLEEFKFNAGYAQTFLSAGATVIDRATIMRLVERQQQQTRGSSSAPDYYRIEADALIGHADYLAEVLLAGADATKGGRETYSVSIKDIKTGQILAMLHTDGLPRSLDNQQNTWQTSSDGYQLTESSGAVEEVNVSNLGRAVALETMQALSALWAR